MSMSMRRRRALLLIAATLLLLVRARDVFGAASLRTQDRDSSPAAIFTALQLPGSVRCALVLVWPADAGPSNVTVDVALPADADLSDTQQTVGRTVFLGNQSGTLHWAAPGYAPGDPVDPFTFFLTKLPEGSFAVHAAWEDATGAAAEQTWDALQPQVGSAIATSGTVTLPAGTMAVPLAVGDTGMSVQVIGGNISSDTEISVQRTDASTNPPDAPGAPWWCAGVSITGLPAGVTLLVREPARQPLPPNLPLRLFLNDGTNWTGAAEAGTSSADGQYASLFYHGGDNAVVAGVPPFFQPTIITLPVQQPVGFSVTIGGTFILHNFQNGSWTITVKNVSNTTLSKVAVHILGDGPIDMHSTVPGPNAVGFGCTITQGLGLGTFTSAVCNIPSLAAGAQKTITLNGGITVAVANPEQIVVVADDNFPDARTVQQGHAGIDVQIN
ncbi:MAG TPA: hypothetical protein VKV26_15590 [Dehalococcoidia bacterium]|nr:hypothetical protein [Dehalococcoidia bacterium]